MENNNHQEVGGNRFFWVTILNIVITIAEFVGGFLAGSLSLISDGFHNLGDSLSIVFSYIASRISRRRQNARNTFGYKRAEIITAFLNSIVLGIICTVLMIEAIKRISNPQPINGDLMLIIAIIGLVANLLSAFLLNAGSKSNLNMRATYLHIMSDALSSIAIIIGGILIDLFNWTLVDPIVTILVALYIIWEAIPIVRQTFRILMQGAPTIDYEAIKRDLLQIDGVFSVHHVHAWSIDENNIIFSAHVNMHDMKISQAQPIYLEITKILKNKYHICHVTIQAETTRGEDEDIIYDRGNDIP
ncbi:cation diffusion facilitator family transporter [Lentilactobacillus sp. IMAU92037]|uniref:cation diffusion facilitator family transporter n=1 Tax=Lentilactobacillus TaxID=2767893 RepID=UPI001C27EA95|nr:MULTISPECIES: cation diffusion facilitator family transporter [Lentilactobacillus]MBU9789222.1 cation diffusion facilitator family transporter [Lentilactobacillus dabitei]MBV0931366.1 cation diffusion facilitator family transporter [Lentilactobacillus dabitei]MDM7516853.1 cation diffusion facilitator family transporter [Lentilactobacillus sp. TOM.63]